MAGELHIDGDESARLGRLLVRIRAHPVLVSAEVRMLPRQHLRQQSLALSQRLVQVRELLVRERKDEGLVLVENAVGLKLPPELDTASEPLARAEEVAVGAAVVVEAVGRPRVARKEDCLPMPCHEQPAVIERLPREVERGEGEFVPLPRLAVLRPSGHGRGVGRDTGQEEPQRVLDDLGQVLIRHDGTAERFVELVQTVDMVVVVVSDPAGIDRGDRSLIEPLLKCVGHDLAAAVKDQGAPGIRDERVARAHHAPDEVGRFVPCGGLHSAGVVLRVVKEMRVAIVDGRDRSIVAPERIQSIEHQLDGRLGVADHVAVRRNQLIGAAGEELL